MREDASHSWAWADSRLSVSAGGLVAVTSTPWWRPSSAPSRGSLGLSPHSALAGSLGSPSGSVYTQSASTPPPPDT